MELNFKPLGEVELLEEVPKNAKLLVETGGKVKRAPAKLGGNIFVYDAFELYEKGEIEVPIEVAKELIEQIKLSDALAFRMFVSEENDYTV
jgi:hypothetical protein